MPALLYNGKIRLANGRLALAAAPPGVGGGTAATALSVSELGPNGKVFQRVGTSKLISVAFNSNGTNVDARVIHARTGAVILDWTPLVTGHPGGNGTAPLLIPQGFMGRLQVRDGVNHTLSASCANQFAVGERVAVIGQSNMYHAFDLSIQYPLASLDVNGIIKLNGSTWASIGNFDATGTYPPSTPSSTYGSNRTDSVIRGDGAVYFANYLSAALGCAVTLFEYAESGSAINTWQPDGSGANWNSMAAAIAAADGDCGSAIWMQGEEDANHGTSSASWMGSLLNILNGLKTLTGRTAANFKFGVVTLGSTSTYGAEGSFGAMRAAQIAFVAANPSTFLAGVAIDGDVTDGVHLSPTAQGRMGKRYAKALLANFAGTDKPGPRVSGATRVGAVVTIAIAGAVGALKDGSGGAGGALLGHRVFCNSVPVTISATSISGGAVLLTLAATPAGTYTYDFGMANAPFGLAPAPASVLYDSDIVPGDTLGLTLQPCALITVT